MEANSFHQILSRLSNLKREKSMTIFAEILDKEKIDAIGRPEIGITKLAAGNPLEFKVTTAIAPTIDSLPDYKAVSAEKTKKPEKAEELPMRVVIPAYVMSEVKTGFQMGFFVFVPFLLIDLVVSTSLLSMGMMQLPPAMISLPFKLVLFVTVDGWSLVVRSLVRSFV